MSRLIETTRGSDAPSLTQCPGTAAYMPPEALITPPHYSSKLDCFSHGVLTIQIVTRLFPNPSDATVIVENVYPIEVRFVPERERRKEHIDLINQDHPLLHIALDCLSDRQAQRPSAIELCDRFASLKSEPNYLQSLQQRNVSVQRELETQRLERELEQSRTSTQRMQRELEQSRISTQTLQRDLEQLQARIQLKEQAIIEAHAEIARRDDEIRREREEYRAVQIAKERIIDDHYRLIQLKTKLLEQEREAYELQRSKMLAEMHARDEQNDRELIAKEQTIKRLERKISHLLHHQEEQEYGLKRELFLMKQKLQQAHSAISSLQREVDITRKPEEQETKKDQQARGYSQCDINLARKQEEQEDNILTTQSVSYLPWQV